MSNFETQIDDFISALAEIIIDIKNKIDKDEIIAKMNDLSLKQRMLQLIIESEDDKENKEYQFLLKYFDIANKLIHDSINIIIEKNE